MRILDELVRQGKISELQMRAISALDIDADDEDELHKVLAQYGLNNQDILNARATAYNLNVLTDKALDTSVKDKLNKDYILENKVMPIKMDNGSLLLGIVDPDHNDIVNAIRLEMLKLGYPYKLSIMDEDLFNTLYKNTYEAEAKPEVESLLKRPALDLSKNIESNANVVNAVTANSNTTLTDKSTNLNNVAEKIQAAQAAAAQSVMQQNAGQIIDKNTNQPADNNVLQAQTQEEAPNTINPEKIIDSNKGFNLSPEMQKVEDKRQEVEEKAVAEKIKEAQEEAIKETKKEEGVTFAGLVNQALNPDGNKAATVADNKKAREEILSEEDLLDISENDGDLVRLENGGDGSAVDEINTILKYSIDSGASDIHIEHAGEYTRVRIRVDGELKEIAAFGKTMHPMIVARVKILSGMRLDEKRKPQDGRFSVLMRSHKIDFRVSTMPGYYGEKIVMRILDSYRGIRKLEEIGFSARHLEQIRVALHKPYGMVLISGPTGSGKTTTLYSMLNEIDRKSKNVVSLEDPIEYNVPSMNQSQVFPEIGYTFASGLRSILRQDPDVIMVGEIRDAETAQLAVQAALTGHLVFSTIHTNNSIGVITRLMDMNVDPFLIAPTLNLAIAQRLTRQIADGAEEPILDNPGIEKIVENEFADLPQEYKDILNLNRPLHSPKALPNNPTGMKGRVPVLEILEIDKELQKAIIDRKTEEEIWKMARAKGMITMKEDAIMKSMDGKVPFVEINNL